MSSSSDVPDQPVAGGNHMWLGDPEAISSVRRARKAPGRQRMDQVCDGVFTYAVVMNYYNYLIG